MKRLMNLFLALGLVACGSVASGQEVLTNGGMDAIDPAGTQQLFATPTGWIVEASRGADPAYLDGLASEGFADVGGDAGHYGVFFKAFTGNPPWDPTAGDVDAHLYQDNPGTPGMKYILTGWAGAEDNWSGFVTPGANAILAIDFLAGAVPIGSAELDLEAAGLGDPANPGLNYEQFMVMAVAPAGTTTVRARASMLDGVFYQDPGQAFVVDDFSLTCIPEPASVMLGLIGMLGVVGLARRR
jgi:hypothetical protein